MMTRDDNICIVKKLLKPLGLDIASYVPSIYKIVDSKGIEVDVIRTDYNKIVVRHPLIDSEFMLDFISGKVIKFVRYNGNAIINPYFGCRSHEELCIVYDLVNNG